MPDLAHERPACAAFDRGSSGLLQHVLGQLPRGLDDLLVGRLPHLAAKLVLVVGWGLSQG